MQSSVSTGNKVKVLTLNAMIVAAYIVLSMLSFGFASGAIQFRISESLNHLVVFNKKLMWGVLGGVIIFNFVYGGFGIVDVIYGGGQTFLSLGLTAILSYFIKDKKTLLVLNTIFFTVSMALIALMLMNMGAADKGFWETYLFLALSELIIMAVSAPIMYYVDKKVHFEART
ncbi:QueT transporter family protein [Enterococcus sp. LJL128]